MYGCEPHDILNSWIQFGEIMILVESRQYKLEMFHHEQILLFTWKQTANPDDRDYMDAIRIIARYCEQEKPNLLLVDKRNLLAQIKFDYTWWKREILPKYHAAGIAGFGHITGKSDAKGLFDAPEGAQFKMAEFETINQAWTWKP